ncbi:MAG: hypothetical protein SGJ19_15910 [Planctomycetia bacterium]|nr:hypothetical protein [Planctomycetia bacterium]
MLRIVLSCVLVCALLRVAVAAKPTFTPLPDFTPTDVSADGTVVVGYGYEDVEYHALRWTKQSGIVPIAPLGGASDTRPSATSADGTVVVGGSADLDFDHFRWTATGGSQPDPPRYEIYDISDDGNIILGNFSNIQPFLWSESESYRWLRPLEVYEPYITALAMTGDATTIVGHVITGPSSRDFEPMRWTEADGFQTLGLPAGETAGYSAVDVTDDGETLLVQKSTRSVFKTFLWSAITGYRELEPGMNLAPTSMSDDGSRVFGSSAEIGTFIWDEFHGARPLQELLVEKYGLGDALQGWSLWPPREVSRDGRTFAGRGFNAEGDQSSWVVTVPEPSGIVLAATTSLSLLTIASRRRRRTGRNNRPVDRD